MATTLQIDLDRSSPVPLYFQVAQVFEKAILEGVLKPGDRFENELALADMAIWAWYGGLVLGRAAGVLLGLRLVGESRRADGETDRQRERQLGGTLPPGDSVSGMVHRLTPRLWFGSNAWMGKNFRHRRIGIEHGPQREFQRAQPRLVMPPLVHAVAIDRAPYLF